MLFSPVDRVFLVVLNNTKHILGMDGFYCSPQGNFTDYSSGKERERAGKYVTDFQFEARVFCTRKTFSQNNFSWENVF